MLLERLFHRGKQRFGFVCSRNRDLAIEDEERYATDARLARLNVLGLDEIAVFRGREVSPQGRFVEPAARTDLREHLGIGQHGPLLEVAPKQALGNGILFPGAGRVMHQTMCLQRIGLNGDRVEGKLDTDLLADTRNARIVACTARTELAFYVGLSRHAFGRNVGIELIRKPAHGWRGLIGGLFSVHRQGGFEATLPDVAPGSNDVRDDLDGELGIHGISIG